MGGGYVSGTKFYRWDIKRRVSFGYRQSGIEEGYVLYLTTDAAEMARTVHMLNRFVMDENKDLTFFVARLFDSFQFFMRKEQQDYVRNYLLKRSISDKSIDDVIETFKQNF